MVRVPMALAIGQYVAEVLMQGPAQCHVQQLDAATDCEKRYVLSNGLLHHGKLEIVVGVDDSIDSVGPFRLAVARWVDVTAALDEDAI